MRISLKFTEAFTTCMDEAIEAFWSVEIHDETVKLASYTADGKKSRRNVLSEAGIVKVALQSAYKR